MLIGEFRFRSGIDILYMPAATSERGEAFRDMS